VAAAVAAPAEGAQPRYLVVADPELELSDLRDLADDGAVGLLVPDAGPETSGARARAALERGAVRNSLLGGGVQGPRLITLLNSEQSRPALPVILVGVPRGGEQPNDKRYPIVVEGRRGVLTSESTRIPGLVSVVDVAPTALRREGSLGSTPSDDPVGALLELDRRIREHGKAKTPVLLISLALMIVVALFRRQAILRAFAAVLLANLLLGYAGWTGGWAIAVVVLAVASLILAAPQALIAQAAPLVGVFVAYLVSMIIDERWVALSPFGPTQNARFYGLSNLLATLLLVPALAGAAILGRRFGRWAFAAVAGLALVTVGGSPFGADGGGVIVLLVGYAVLVVLEYGVSRRMLVGAVAVVAVVAAALVAGGESHVTGALGDGPAGLAEDFARRLELSWLRATAGWGVGLLVAGGVGALAVLAARERRPLLLAYLSAIAVSLVVNDSPNDVVIAGLAGYLVLSSAPGVARPAGERATQAAREPRARSAPAALP
jgi:hypothetical protein